MFAVFLNSARATISAHGEIAATIQAKPEPAFRGDAAATVDFLKALGVGASVETRAYRDDGSWRWIRSCMNKPALWADIMSDA